MTCACVHLGVHEHPVKNGEYQDFKDRSRTLLAEQVERTPHATNSSIVMEATKKLLGELLLRLEGAPAKTFTFEELVPVLDKYRYMSSPSIRNDVTSFRYREKLVRERGARSGEQGFHLHFFWNFDDHGEEDLLPWIINVWTFINYWR
jgi:hypothetical protein